MKQTNLNAAPRQALEIINDHTRVRASRYLLSCMCVTIPLCWLSLVVCATMSIGDKDQEFKCSIFPTCLSAEEKIEFQNMIRALNECIVNIIDPETFSEEAMEDYLRIQFQSTKNVLASYENKFKSSPGYQWAITTAISNVDKLETQQNSLNAIVPSYDAVFSPIRPPVQAQPLAIQDDDLPPPYYDIQPLLLA